MKKYLKMADVFTIPLRRFTEDGSIGNVVDADGDCSIYIQQIPSDSRSSSKRNCRAEHAAHAINSHDELVQINQELLAALKQVVGDVRALADHSYGVHGLHQNGDLAPWNSLFSGGFFESWLLSVDDADAVIAKTEGGAA